MIDIRFDSSAIGGDLQEIVADGTSVVVMPKAG